MKIIVLSFLNFITQTIFFFFLFFGPCNIMLTRSCYWYDFGFNPENQVQIYINLLGEDWEIARVLGGISTTLSFYFLCYSTSYICSAQVRGVRYFNSFLLSVVLVTCQGLTFLVFTSELCQDYGCTFSRSAGFSIAAMICFLLAGICFLFTHDYPGNRFVEEVVVGTPAAAAAAAAATVVATKDIASTDDEAIIKQDDDDDDDEIEEEVYDEEDMEEEVVEEEEDEEMGEANPSDDPPAINAMASAEA
jgi:hypothetical protein